MHDQFHTSANIFAVYGTFSRSFVLVACHYYETDSTTTTATTTTTTTQIIDKCNSNDQQNFLYFRLRLNGYKFQKKKPKKTKLKCGQTPIVNVIASYAFTALCCLSVIIWLKIIE
jgi:hypothetical protein